MTLHTPPEKPVSETFLTLNDVGSGEICMIKKHRGNGSVRQRLLDLGFIPKRKVQVIRSAPLKDPIEVQIGDAYIALRRTEARLIEVANV